MNAREIKRQLSTLLHLILILTVTVFGSPSHANAVQGPCHKNLEPRFHISHALKQAISEGKLSMELIGELFDNRVSRPIPEFEGQRRTERYWFISEGNDQLRYKVVMVQSREIPMVIYVRPSTPAMERLYFRIAGVNVSTQIYPLLRPLKGKNEVVIPGSVAIKILEKHHLGIDDVIQAAKTFDGNYYLNEDMRHNGGGQDTFIIYGNLEDRRIKMAFKIDLDGSLILLTAFEPGNLSLRPNFP